MRKLTAIALSALLIPVASRGQDTEPTTTTTTKTTKTTVSTELSPETRDMLLDRQQRDRAADIEAALRIKSEADAQSVVDLILSKARVDTILSESTARARIRSEEAKRTQGEREKNIAYLKKRLSGGKAVVPATKSLPTGVIVEAPATETQVVRTSKTRYYQDNNRVVTYRTMNEVPPVLIASSRLDRVKLQQISESPYATELLAIERRPAAYIAPEGYAVSYSVDPNSEVSRDDILFVQGSTAFADAYSYDLVVDLAMAINDPALAGERFVVEGHASAEGDYAENLALSQARAERIVREMVNSGVSTSRLIPIGYGENEALHPGNAAENIRATDRRVTVYRMN